MFILKQPAVAKTPEPRNMDRNADRRGDDLTGEERAATDGVPALMDILHYKFGEEAIK